MRNIQICCILKIIHRFCESVRTEPSTHLPPRIVEMNLLNFMHITASRSRQDSWADPAKKIRPLEKKLGLKQATPKIIWRSVVKIYECKVLCQFLPIIVKSRPQLGNLELGCFLGRWFPWPKVILLGHFWVSGPEFGHLAAVMHILVYRVRMQHCNKILLNPLEGNSLNLLSSSVFFGKIPQHQTGNIMAWVYH